MSLVWYAAYGSNMSRRRLAAYIEGGPVEGTHHTYLGSRRADAPVRESTLEITGELVFGGTSRTWGGGVASLDPDLEASVPTKARLYLITLEQFEDIVAQENWLEPGSIDITEPTNFSACDVGKTLTYGRVLNLGTHEGMSVLTVTKRGRQSPRKPAPAYLRHIGAGLAEAYGMGPLEIASYLVTRPGVRGELSADELELLFRAGPDLRS